MQHQFDAVVVLTVRCRCSSTHQQVVEFDVDAHGHGQSLIQGEAGARHQDVVPGVTQDTDSQVNGMTAAAGQDHILEEHVYFSEHRH